MYLFVNSADVFTSNELLCNNSMKETIDKLRSSAISKEEMIDVMLVLLTQTGNDQNLDIYVDYGLLTEFPRHSINCF